MTERPEERLVRLLESLVQAWPRDTDLLPIARAMAEGMKALREIAANEDYAEEDPVSRLVARQTLARTALQALDSRGPRCLQPLTRART